KTIDKAATEETEVFDGRGLLKRLDGDEELFDELLDLYLQDVPVRLKELKHALEDNDIAMIVQQAHTIMGASANIGAHSLRDLAFEMEMAARDNNLDKARPFCRRLEKEFAKFRSMLSGSVLSDNEKQRKED
ncbi:MAG: Hpt domain-containing protein, partial [Desulfatiglandales bacterium]